MLWAILAGLCGLAVLFIWMVLPGESNAAQRAPFWGLNIAHRGLHSKDKTIPENSLAAFTAAIDAGYGIELDIQLSKDNEVVVFHDDDLRRVCGVAGRVDSYTLAELKAFRLFGTGQAIPTLKEVLALVNQQVPLVIELKTGPKRIALCHAAWNILCTYDGDICVESFDPRILRMFKKYVPGLLRGQLIAAPKTLGGTPASYLVGWGLGHFLGRPHFLACHKGKMSLPIRFAGRFAMRLVWTVTDTDDYDSLEDAYDAVIFEGYQPLPRYHDKLDEPPFNPAEEDIFKYNGNS